MAKSLEITKAAQYLSGIIDGEGCISLVGPKNAKGYPTSRSVKITNTDWDIINACTSYYDLIGIKYRTYVFKRVSEQHKPKIEIYVFDQNSLIALFNLLDLKSKKKHEKLKEIITSYMPKIVVPPKSELEDLYNSGLGLKQLKERYNVSIATISNWLRKYGIATRSSKDTFRILKKRKFYDMASVSTT